MPPRVRCLFAYPLLAAALASSNAALHDDGCSSSRLPPFEPLAAALGCPGLSRRLLCA